MYYSCSSCIGCNASASCNIQGTREPVKFSGFFLGRKVTLLFRGRGNKQSKQLHWNWLYSNSYGLTLHSLHYCSTIKHVAVYRVGLFGIYLLNSFVFCLIDSMKFSHFITKLYTQSFTWQGGFYLIISRFKTAFLTLAIATMDDNLSGCAFSVNICAQKLLLSDAEITFSVLRFPLFRLLWTAHNNRMGTEASTFLSAYCLLGSGGKPFNTTCPIWTNRFSRIASFTEYH